MFQKHLRTILTASILSTGLAVAIPAQAQSSDRQPIHKMESGKPSQTKTGAAAQSRHDVTDKHGSVVQTMGPRDKEPKLMMDYEPRRTGIRE